MEIISTREAADRAGISVQKWHRTADRLNIVPVHKIDGTTGAKLWTVDNVTTVTDYLTGAAS